MGINADNIDLIRYIQQKKQISLEDLAVKFGKTSSSIRKEIYKINQEDERKIIFLKNSVCSTKMSYTQLAEWISAISMVKYQSLKTERIQILILKAFFDGYVNATKLYESWGISLTTKKKDTLFLKEYLSNYNLEVYYKPKKGLIIVGDPLKNRILICNILYSLYDIDEKGNFSQRVTNTPIERICYEYIELLHPYFSKVKPIMDIFLYQHKLQISGLSEKFGILFMSLYHHQPFNLEKNYIENLPLHSVFLSFSEDINENQIYSLVLPLLDYSKPFIFPKENILFLLVSKYIHSIVSRTNQSIYTIRNLVEECYHLFYKQIFIQHFSMQMPDRLLQHLDESLLPLYKNIEKEIVKFEEFYPLGFNWNFYVTLTLTIQKNLLKNQLINHKENANRKKVVIVSNSTYERIDYFISQVKEKFEIEFISVLNLAQRFQLKNFSYDYIFCLSERIFRTLYDEGYPVLQLHYFLENSDIDQLEKLKFPNTRNKFLAKEFVEDLEGRSIDEKILYLKEKYSDHFI